MRNKHLHLVNAKGIALFILLFVATGATPLLSQSVFDDGTLKYVVFENTSNDDGTIVFVTGLTSSGRTIKNLIIPDSVSIEGKTYAISWIMPYAFSGCADLVSVILPSTITSIGDGTFFNCTALLSVTIPNSLTNIGSYAFYGCRNLNTITFPEQITIQDNAFKGCDNLYK